MSPNSHLTSKIFQPVLSRAEGDEISWGLITHILSEIKTEAVQGNKPLLVMDLDSTLINTAFRTANIFHEYALVPKHIKANKNLCDKILSWEKIGEVFYPEEFVSVHCDETFVLKSEQGRKLRKWWTRRFFDPKYLQHDIAYAGAKSFLDQALKNGGSIAYLTGRNQNTMYAASIESLQKNKLPIEMDKVRLQLRPDDQKDLEYKSRELKRLSQGFSPVWFIDNEAQLVEMSHRVHKDIKTIFFDSVHSRKADISGQNIPAIKSWALPVPKSP